MATIRLNANLMWTAERGAETNRWIGVCDPLGLSMEADSIDELHSLIPEAIHLLMVDLVEDNELDGFLQDRGWTARRDDVGSEFEVDVPWMLAVAGDADGQSRRAH